MCGICGIIDLRQPASREAGIRGMMQAMKHRGPDDEGVLHEGHVHLGFVRLSIIDLTSAGHQPMLSADGRFALIFNGEIYNYIELRAELSAAGVEFRTRTDAEVLLAAYQAWGEECLDRFNGMWSFVIHDRVGKKIFAARDRFGIKPFYYLRTKDMFAFASEIPPLLPLLGRKPSPDNQSIFDYLVFNRSDQTERTFFEEVRKLQHGHSLSIEWPEDNHQEAEVRIKKWYDLRSNLREPFRNPGEFRELLSSAIGLRLRSDVPVGVCLSGGLDSSSIVSILLKDFQKQDLNTFSAIYGKGQPGDETEFIDEYKPLLKNMFFTTPSADTLHADLADFVKAHAEPIPSTSPYAQFKVMQLARDKVVVTLDGQGADEELAGYHYFFGFYFKDLLKQARLGKLSLEMFYYLVRHRSLYGIKTFPYFLLPKGLKTRLRVNEKGYLHDDFVAAYRSGNSIAGSLYDSGSLQDALLDHFEYKLEHLLKWEDRNSMWFSLEARVPFLDYRLVEKTLATPADRIIKNGMTKHLLRESMKGILPETIRLRRDKVGFDTPQDEWFRNPAWKELVSEILNSRSFAGRGIVNPDDALRTYESHISGKKNASKEIWKWVHLELWHREFIDG
jgi:asparagine synthase (glutamine-hydrolysing)